MLVLTRRANQSIMIGDDIVVTVLDVRGLSPDVRSISFAVVNRPDTKAEDRAPADTLARERARPRTTRPFP